MSEETDEQLSSPIFSDFTNTDDIDVRVSLQQCELSGLPFLLNYHYTVVKDFIIMIWRVYICKIPVSMHE